METFHDNSSTFLNLGFSERLNGRPFDIIEYSFAIVKQVLLEIISSCEFPSIPNISENFEKLLELLADVIFDAKVKPDITDELVSLDEMVLLELLLMVDLMPED